MIDLFSQPPFFNTTSETGASLAEYRSKATIQAGKVLDFFTKHPGQSFTPNQVWKAVFDPSTPLTSVRRAITVLTGAGKLVKTAEKRDGGYGRPSYTWRLTTVGFV
jgi:hypothetical protein